VTSEATGIKYGGVVTPASGYLAARFRSSSGEWSALATCSWPLEPLIITEINTHDDWVEVYNPNARAVPLRDYAVSDPKDVEFFGFFASVAANNFSVFHLTDIGLGASDSLRLLQHHYKQVPMSFQVVIVMR